VRHQGRDLGRVRLRLAGQHNALNALAALAVAHEVEVPFRTAADALVIPQLAIDCGAPSLTESQLEWQYSTQVGPAVGSLAPAGDGYASDLLNNSEVLVGYHGAAGTEIDRVGLIMTSLDLPVAANLRP